MTRLDTLLLVLYAFALSLGQVLFKYASPVAANARGFDLVVGLARSPAFVAAAALYAGLTVYWTWLLSRVPLSRAYPFIALCFLFVPLMARLFFGERTPPTFLVGLALIVAGLGVITLGAAR
jgi:undecaprenyl phosphate-alpha-L-ara4N flippase subunit ArnE